MNTEPPDTQSIETSLRRLAARDLSPRAEDAELLERLYAAADAACAPKRRWARIVGYRWRWSAAMLALLFIPLAWWAADAELPRAVVGEWSSVASKGVDAVAHINTDVVGGKSVELAEEEAEWSFEWPESQAVVVSQAKSDDMVMPAVAVATYGGGAAERDALAILAPSAVLPGAGDHSKGAEKEGGLPRPRIKAKRKSVRSAIVPPRERLRAYGQKIWQITHRP